MVKRIVGKVQRAREGRVMVGGVTVHWSTRNFPKRLAKEIKEIAWQYQVSQEVVFAIAVGMGLTKIRKSGLEGI